MLHWIKKIILREKSSSREYVNFLRKKGVHVGIDVEIFRPFNTTIDIQNPHLLSIGDHVMITGPVTILTHDYSWCVLKRKYGDIVGNQRKTVIGSNVFIGWGAIILGGSCIGDNVIIGANSVVSGCVESDSVYAGNPAKKIMSLDEYYKKRQDRQLEEAVEFVHEFQNRFGELPEEKELDEYFFLFAENSEQMNERFDFKMKLMQNKEQSYERLLNCNRFTGYTDFLEYCKEN